MREIIFRGKRVDNGEWIYGCFVKTDRCFVGEYNEEMQVIPETVGQCTGLVDKNGKRIFEGDTVECKRRNKIDSILGTIKGCVIFSNEAYEGAYIDCGESDWMELGLNKTFIYEVTGNIHEQELNPLQRSSVINNMNTQLDPGTKQEETQEQAAETTEANQASEAAGEDAVTEE